MTRRWVRNLHVYLGLVIGLWLIVLGLTGSLIVYYREIDAALNADLFATSPGPNRAPDALVAAAETLGPVQWITWPTAPGDPAVAGIDRGERLIGIYIDPRTGRLNGARDLDALGLDRRAIVNTVYMLHAEILLGDAGLTLVGITSFVFIFLSISGLYLWWPRVWRASRFWFQKRSKGIRFHFDLHKVTGLYSSIFLLFIAVSGLSFAFPSAFEATVRTILPETGHSPDPLRASSVDGSWAAAAAVGQKLFPLSTLSEIRRNDDATGLIVTVRQPGEFRFSRGATEIAVDPNGLAVVQHNPLSAGAGDRVLESQFPIHNGEIAGQFGRFLVAVAGIAPLILGITGFLVWWRTRPRKRAKGAHRDAKRGAISKKPGAA